MKGVDMIRAKLRPVAACQRKDCGWIFGGSHFPAATIRANAEHHVQDTGHPVEVVIQDITRYTPELTPQAITAVFDHSGNRARNIGAP